MRFLCFLVAFVFSAMSVCAKPITREQAYERAVAFMQLQKDTRTLTLVTNRKKLAPRKFGALATAETTYYIFNKGVGNGFVIVSGDDEVEPVLGYCDSGEFDYEQMPPNMREWLDDYDRQIAQLHQAGKVIFRDAIPTHPRVEPLLTCTWNQGYPYNLTCPDYFSLGRSVTGCVATAMAQLLYYNRDKSVTETQADMPSYETRTSHATYGKLHVDGIPAGSAIDWKNMKDEYSSSSTEIQRKAVADLMHYCGVAVKMDYTHQSSGAYSYDVYTALKDYFGYGESVRYYSNSETTDVQWDQIVYSDIAAGRPIYISGSNSSGGHAFCADGYDGNRHFHINWGWGGTSDGWYLLTNLTPGQQGIGGSSDGYNNYRNVITGIEPENYGTKAMSFADATVKTLCVKNWDADKDGKLTYDEAAAITSLGAVFKGKTNIRNFSELYYFTGLTAVDDDAFNGCSQLASIRLPKKLQRIGARAFKGCSKIELLTLPTDVNAIGEEAFSGCRLIEELKIPTGVSAIEPGSFKNCASITSIELPLNVGSIGNEAFAGCTKLSDFTVNGFAPQNIVLGENIFGTLNLSKVTLNIMQGTKAYFTSNDQWQKFGNIVERRELSEGKFVAFELGKSYYLYNVGMGMYLTKGEAYGTQAIVGSSPMRFIVRKSGTNYYMTSVDTGNDGIYLFRTSTDDNVGQGVQATFIDGTSLTSNAYWNIQAVADSKYGQYTYTIQTPDSTSQYWGVQTSHASQAAMPTYGVYSDIDYSVAPQNCLWQFVAYDAQAAERFKEAQRLGNLLKLAKQRNLKTEAEQAVYDNLESSLDELRSAESSLRSMMHFIEFANEQIREVCVSRWDINNDGELSVNEASQVSDFNYSFYGEPITHFDEFRYFSSINSIYGASFQSCEWLESITLPANLINIYYYAFLDCKKLKKINLPEFVRLIGESCFENCTSLTEVSISNPNPDNIELGNNVFKNVDLSKCTLIVPYGSKERYAKADVWKNFGKIEEMRIRTQPKFSPITANTPGYLYNIGSRKFLAMGEAYGTQSVVKANGMTYELRREDSKPEGYYYLYSEETGQDGKIVFRVFDNTKVGVGVRTCFGDGTLSSAAYWKTEDAGGNTFRMQVPTGYTYHDADQWLGVYYDHSNQNAYPTSAIYWDLAGGSDYTLWAFVSADDMATALDMDEKLEQLGLLLEKANKLQLDVTNEQAVYDNLTSSYEAVVDAVLSLRKKLHFIDFIDEEAKKACLANWDADSDGELTLEEAAAVTDIGQLFRSATNMRVLEELKYFTSLTEIPSYAFQGLGKLETVFLPSSVSTIKDYAFTGCGNMKYLVILNSQQAVPFMSSGIPASSTVFVSKDLVQEYQADEMVSMLYRVVEYTGKPIVSAEAKRMYGGKTANVLMTVSGAPIVGDAEIECEGIADPTLPVGNYPIAVRRGTIITEGVELVEGVFTIEPWPLIITAKSYTRNVGEANPTFELTYRTFCNKETEEEAFTQKPVVSCTATPDSPAGEYEIVVSGAEAHNYAITYVSGKLTVVDPLGIETLMADDAAKKVYDLQGRKVQRASRGLYILRTGQGAKKVIQK